MCILPHLWVGVRFCGLVDGWVFLLTFWYLTAYLKHLSPLQGYFSRAMAISITRWEVGHLKIHQLVCDYIKSFGPYTCECEGKVYLNQTKMKTSTTYATDVEIMAAAQICGIDIYIYHWYGNGLRWLKFPCKHQSRTPLTNAIYLDNRYGNGKTGHFHFVMGLF